MPSTEDQNATPDRLCPDCKTQLEAIKILDATAGPNGFGQYKGGALHIQLSYAAPESQPSWFTRTIQREGIVQGYICPKCARILLYGQPLNT